MHLRCGTARALDSLGGHSHELYLRCKALVLRPLHEYVKRLAVFFLRPELNRRIADRIQQLLSLQFSNHNHGFHKKVRRPGAKPHYGKSRRLRARCTLNAKPARGALQGNRTDGGQPVDTTPSTTATEAVRVSGTQRPAILSPTGTVHDTNGLLKPFQLV